MGRWRKAHHVQGLARRPVRWGHGGIQYQAPLREAGKRVDCGDALQLQIFFFPSLLGCLRVGRVGPADIPTFAQGMGLKSLYPHHSLAGGLQS